MCIHMSESKGFRGPVCDSRAAPAKGYGQFSKFNLCFCGLDSGNLKFETVRTNRQRICLKDLRRSI